MSDNYSEGTKSREVTLEEKQALSRKVDAAGSVSNVVKINDPDLSARIAVMFKDAEDVLRIAVEAREEQQRREQSPANRI